MCVCIYLWAGSSISFVSKIYVTPASCRYITHLCMYMYVQLEIHVYIFTYVRVCMNYRYVYMHRYAQSYGMAL